MPFDFPATEYHRRIAKTRDAMAANGIDVMLIADPSNMAWLTGYDAWSFYVHQCVVLTADGMPIWFGRGMDASAARKTVFMDDEFVVDYGDEFVQNPDPEFHPMVALAAVLDARGWAGRAIGVEMDNYYFSAAAYCTLRAKLPQANFIDATYLVNRQRAHKSPLEIEYMKRAAKIVAGMHERAYREIEPGMKKNELVARIYQTAIEGADGYGGDYPAIVPLVPTGADAGAAHMTWDERPIPPDSGTFFELAGAYKRYHCPLCRTIYLGKPPDKFRRAEAALLDGIAAGMEIAKPGNRCGDIAEAFYRAIGKHGFEKDTRCGYPIGLSYPPDWGERTMSFRRGDKNRLEAGMTFHFMPCLWFEDWGVEISESLLITADGCETLANYPRELRVKGI